MKIIRAIIILFTFPLFVEAQTHKSNYGDSVYYSSEAYHMHEQMQEYNYNLAMYKKYKKQYESYKFMESSADTDKKMNLWILKTRYKEKADSIIKLIGIYPPPSRSRNN